jgi:hypothetical protein
MWYVNGSAFEIKGRVKFMASIIFVDAQGLPHLRVGPFTMIVFG